MKSLSFSHRPVVSEARRSRRLATLAGLTLVLGTARPALQAADASRGGTPATTRSRPAIASVAPPEARLLLRTGDVAPVEGRATFSTWGDLAERPDGGILFRAQGDDTLLLLENGRVRELLGIGERIAGCGTVSSINEVAAGADGSIAALLNCRQVQAIVRLDPGGAPPVVALVTGTTFTIGGAQYPVYSLRRPALDGAGRLVSAVGSAGVEALVRQSPGGAVETLLASGDPLGTGLFTTLLEAPSVNASGMVAFAARTNVGTELIATLVAGSAPVVRFSVPDPAPPFYPPPLGAAPPSVNSGGEVAFLWETTTGSMVQRATNGGVQTVAAPGDPAPGGGTLSPFSWTRPVIDDAGGVLFFALRSDGRSGLYRSGSPTTRVAENDDPVEGGTSLQGLGSATGSPLAARDGAVRFVSTDTLGAGLFASRDGSITVDLRSGTPLETPARFVALENLPIGFLPSASVGPDLAADGAVLFDAVATGRGRGLYLYAPDGGLTPIAIDGDEAPEGGHFDGSRFIFHTVAAGQVAFLGSAPDSDRGGTLQLFSGPAGGPLRRLVGGGDFLDGYDPPISSLRPPSRINTTGAIVVPATLADGRWILLAWDGTMIRVLGVSGDTLPDGDQIVNPPPRPPAPGALVAPLLDDAGSVLFDVQTRIGGRALYRMEIEGGIATAARVLGEGDPVQGGSLPPAGVRALSADRTGRLAFQAIPSAGLQAETYSADVGPIPRLVVVPPDPIPPAPGFDLPVGAWPRLAATAGGGVVHEVSTTSGTRRRLYFASPRVPANPDPDQAYDQVLLVGPFVPSPDGGQFTRWSTGQRFGSPFGDPGEPMRLGSDGDRHVVAVEPTSQGPEILVLFDLRPNQAPIAAAGEDQTIECTGPDGAAVTLDAGGSADPDGDPIDYAWTGPFGTAVGSSPTVTVPLGTWTITLAVTDPAGAISLDTVVVTVRDTTAPALSVHAVPDRLWPPDGRLASIVVGVALTDRCDPQPILTLEAIASNDPKFDPATDVAGAAYGTGDRIVFLRAKRTGGIGGRIYTLSYAGTDHSGNAASAATTVLVPQNSGN